MNLPRRIKYLSSSVSVGTPVEKNRLNVWYEVFLEEKKVGIDAPAKETIGISRWLAAKIKNTESFQFQY